MSRIRFIYLRVLKFGVWFSNAERATRPFVRGKKLLKNKRKLSPGFYLEETGWLLPGGDRMAGAMGNFSKTKESCLPSLTKHSLPVHGSLVGRAFAT